MGFKVFNLMNDALLVKQAWRILTCPELLISRVYKAKYFTNDELLMAEAGNRPSWAWRSIQGVIPFLKNWLHRSLPDVEAVNAKDLTVKEIYAFMLEDWLRKIRSVIGESSDNIAVRSFWHKFWRVKAQGKVKIFLWRLFHNAVPSAVNLWKRGCVVETKCVRCGYPAECTTHIFLQCWWAQEFWRQLLGVAGKMQLCFSSMADWIWFCVKEFDGEELSLIFYGIRWIWYARNVLWHNGVIIELSAAVSKVKAIVKEISRADYRFVISRDEAGGIWSRPEVGSVSINCDGAWESLSGIAGVGAIGRNSEGQVVFVAAGRVGKCSSAIEAEGKALLAGMKEADRLGIYKASFITDSVEVLLYLQGRRSFFFFLILRWPSHQKGYTKYQTTYNPKNSFFTIQTTDYGSLMKVRHTKLQRLPLSHKRCRLSIGLSESLPTDADS
ncbi:hypothetical protein QQ045_019181 [Rhodiola kirilowii]